MDKKLNWGLLSTAKINQALIKPLRASKRTLLLAVASRSISTAEAYAHEWNIPRAHGSYDALLADPEIDVIYNSLPNHLHAKWAIKALRAGKHVLCEKPIALTLADVDAMSQAARETGKVLEEAFMYRHHAQTLKVKEIVDSGALGKIQLIKGAFTFSISREGDIRLQKETGGGSIWDIGCYPISYAQMIVGADPVEVFGWQVTGQSGVDESFIGQMRFENGVHAQFDSGFRSPSRSMIEIVGTKASLTIPAPFKPRKTTEVILTSDDKQEKIKIKASELYLGEVENMCDAITTNKPLRVSHKDSRGNIATILALLESAKTGKIVPL
jgi:D-xylose 1-dehydrogenase (NADP+, D-xylono-1,5-lactone-forming)